jgi:hypothetical protein
MVTNEEYRKLLGDYKSTDEQIKKRVEYLEAFCRKVIKLELQNYGNKTKK